MAAPAALPRTWRFPLASRPAAPHIRLMQTFRAYLNGPAGTLAWAAWIEAADLNAAQVRAAGLCGQGVPTVELWTPSAVATGDAFEAV